MKTTKKILSIVLAVMLLVGTVVVGVSADTTMVFEKAGSKLVYTAQADKTVTDDEGYILVQPGDEINVSVYMQANYYIGAAGSEIFAWTTGFFNTVTKDTDITKHNFINNYSFANDKLIAAKNATQLGYSDKSHEGYLCGRLINTEAEPGPFDASTPVLVYKFKFTVASTAADGATADFLMPEACSATVATTTRMKQIHAAVNNSATEYGSAAIASSYPETIDVSGTVLKFKVGTAAAPEVPCDYTALDAAIAAYEAKAAEKDLYANWADYEAAYNAAKAVARDMIADEAGANQKVIDDAAAALNAVKLTYKPADYSAVNAAEADAAKVDRTKYTAASLKALDDAVAAVVTGYDITKQAEVTAMAKAINDAIEDLVPLGTANYAALDAAIAAYEAKAAEKDLYANWADYEAAYNAAKAVARDMIADEAGANQKVIDDAAAALNAVKLTYKPADYSAVNAAEADAAKVDRTKYTAASLKALDDAVAAVVTGYDITKQAEVDAMAKAINDAIEDLVPLGTANYAALDAAIAAYEAKAAEKDLYANWADYEAAYNAAKAVARDMIADEAGANQKVIDDAAAALNAVKLTYKPADYSKVAEAINLVRALDPSAYTAASLNAVNNAVAAVKYGYDITKQAEVDAMAKAINDAIGDLVPLGTVNYAALDAAIAAYDALNKSDWTPASWTESGVDAAYAAAKAVARDMIADEAGVNQAKADDAAAALNAAIEKLVAVANKADLAAAIATAPANKGIYTDETWAAFEAALATANRVNADANATQKAVDDATAALIDAIDKLDTYKVDLAALEAAVANFAKPEKAEAYYDATEYAAWVAAFDNAKQGLNDYAGKDDTAANREAVAALAADLENAYKALDARYIDYSALEAAVAAYGTTPEAAEDYTAETYEPYAAALKRAKDMLANKTDAPASDVALAAQIAAAATELETTFKALEVETYVTIITDVTCAQEYFKVGDTVNFKYLCSVTGVTKIQLVLESGATLTYHRTHDAVSIKDNGDGTETWTIATKVYGENSKVVAKAKLGKVWEEKGYKYNVVVKDGEDYLVKSAEVLLNGEAVTEFMTTDSVVIKIVAGSSTLRIRLVDQVSGATSTYTRTKATQDENGNWVWLIERKAGAGSYAYDIYTTGSKNKLTDEGTDLTYTVKAPVVVSGPSTGETKDVVISAKVEKARVISGNNATVTVVTDKNAKGVRVVDQYGAVQGYNKDTASATVDGDTLVWTITYKCVTAGSYNCKVEALYGNQWMNNGATVTYKVAY